MAVDIADLERDDDLKDIVDPLVGKIEQLTAEIETAENLVKLMKAKRMKYLTVVRSIDPSKAPSLYTSRKNGKKKPANKPVGHALNVQVKHQEVLANLTDWVQPRKDELNEMWNGDGFRAVDILEKVPFPVGTNLTKYLAELHEGGVLHLSKWAKGADHSSTGGKPAGKFYKVV